MRDLSQPPEVREFDDALGVVKYSFFVEASGSDACLRAAILWHLSKVLAAEHGTGWLDPDVLAALAFTPVDRTAFFGPRFDPKRQALVQIGYGEVEGGVWLENPTYDELGDRRIVRWSTGSAETRSYGYAFTQPIYPLQLPRLEVQRLFRRINSYILGNIGSESILDWSGPALEKLSVHLEDGFHTASWGAFLYTLFDSAEGRLAVMSAATSP